MSIPIITVLKYFFWNFFKNFWKIFVLQLCRHKYRYLFNSYLSNIIYQKSQNFYYLGNNWNYACLFLVSLFFFFIPLYFSYERKYGTIMILRFFSDSIMIKDASMSVSHIFLWKLNFQHIFSNLLPFFRINNNEHLTKISVFLARFFFESRSFSYLFFYLRECVYKMLFFTRF